MSTAPVDIPAELRRVFSEITDAELFSLCADVLTVMLGDMRPPETKADVEFRRTLAGLRDECMDRHARGEHHSAEPRGNG